MRNTSYIKDNGELKKATKAALDLRDYFLNLSKFVDEEMEEEDIDDLIQFISRFKESHSASGEIDMDTIKVVFALKNGLSNSDIQRILSFLESSGYGWQEDGYHFSNLCLERHPTDHCKAITPTSDDETIMERITNLQDVFFDKEYGSITLLLFSYCLAAVFYKRLNRQHYLVPFYIQIACDQSSGLFQLIEEIAEICDVNSGLFRSCFTVANRECEYRSQIYHPTSSVDRDLDALMRENSDTPVIVEGYENPAYYSNLLRSVANIPNNRGPLGLRDRFNVLPLFVCPTIKPRFANVFSMDLTELDISTTYLECLEENKQFLASYVLEFVKYSSSSRLFRAVKENVANDGHESNKFITKLGDMVRKKYPVLTLTDAKGVGFFYSVFSEYLKTIFGSFRTSDLFPLADGRNVTKEELMSILLETASNKLADIHLRYHPAPSKEGIQNKDALRLAKQITKHYKALSVSIRLIPVMAENERYVFRVETLEATKDSDVISKAETIQHRLKKYECFRFDKTDGKEIKLIVAENQLQDNSLEKILKCESFSDPKKMLPYAIGIDEIGKFYVEDIVDFPHLLIGGSTDSGKSTAIRSLLLSIAYKHHTGDAQVIIMDLLNANDKSKLSVFNDHPIMVCPVIQDTIKAANTILALNHMMENRPQDRSAKEVPYIVCVIDEFPTLFEKLNKEQIEQVKTAMSSLLSKGRHANIHLVLSAQDPTKDSVGKVANAKVRMAFYCCHYRYSNNIIGNAKAVKLTGKGQMILNSDRVRDKRLLGAFIDDAGIEKLLNDTKASFVQINTHRVNLPIVEGSDFSLDGIAAIPSKDGSDLPKKTRFKTFEELLPDAIMWTLPQEKVANSRLLQHLHVRDAMGRQILEWMSGHNLIVQLNGNHGWKVATGDYADLDDEVIHVLSAAGYTEDEISAVIKGIIVKKETELPRTVDQDKIEEFLNSHRHMESEDESEISQVDMPDMQIDEEATQEESIELAGEIVDIQKREDNNETASSSSSTRKLIESVNDAVKRCSDRHKIQRKPSH